MNIREFAKPVTAKSLNESLAKRFGKRISLESFTLGQLQNARNKLRTTLSQVEMSEAFNAVIESENYQKNKMTDRAAKVCEKYCDQFPDLLHLVHFLFRKTTIIRSVVHHFNSYCSQC